MMKSFRRTGAPSMAARIGAPALSALALVAITACSGAEDNKTADATNSSDTAPAAVAATSTSDAATIETISQALTDPAAIKRGKLVFLQCRACHALKAEEGHKVGPNLAGLFGATIGSQDGFNYSTVLTESTDQWTLESLNGFLTKPSDYFSGTIMAFGGVSSVEDRAAVIAYLQSETGE